MFRTIIPVAVIAVLACPAWTRASADTAAPRRAPVDPGSAISTMPGGSVKTQDGKHGFSRGSVKGEMGLMVPDFEGNYVFIPAGKRPNQDPDYVNAQELKLKARELASQLLDTWPNDSLAGMVAMPATFVCLDDMKVTSPLGRYLAEAMFYEFNTRGFAIREYRTDGKIHFEPHAEQAITRERADIRIEAQAHAVLTGTYYRDKTAVFVNARLIRASDGLVLRTGQLVLAMTPVIDRMSIPQAPHPFERGEERGGLRIVQGRR